MHFPTSLRNPQRPQPFYPAPLVCASMKYQLLEHTADLLIRASGSTLEECFANAAYAMFDLVVDASAVRQVEERRIEVEPGDKEELLFEMLSELLYIHDVEGMVFSGFEIAFVDGGLRCLAKGEKLDIGRHLPRTEIKAVTYHMLRVDQEEPSVTVLFDI